MANPLKKATKVVKKGKKRATKAVKGALKRVGKEIKKVNPFEQIVEALRKSKEKK